MNKLTQDIGGMRWRLTHHGGIRWLGKFSVLGNFFKIFKHQVQGFYHQVHWLKRPMLAYGKNMPGKNKFSGFLPRKSKILPKIKSCPISLKIYPKTQNLPSHRVPHSLSHQGSKLNFSQLIQSWQCWHQKLSRVGLELMITGWRVCLMIIKLTLPRRQASQNYHNSARSWRIVP